MAQRTSIKKVRNELTRDYDAGNNPSLQPFIASAVAITDRVVACAIRRGKTLTNTIDATQDEAPSAASEEEIVETLLAAHFYKYAWDKQQLSKSSAGASDSYSPKTAMYLEGTSYGQSAMVVDPSGCLRAISAGARASGRWLGRRPSAQTAYRDRD